MIDEEKVKLMTHMAIYEKNHGKEDFKISSYFKKDYTSYHTILTVIWITVGYIIACGILGSTFAIELMEKFNIPFMIMIGVCVLAGYGVCVILYGLVAMNYYSKKHEDARERVKNFNHELSLLNRIYEGEEE